MHFQFLKLYGGGHIAKDVPSLISNCRHFSPGYQNIFLTQENTSAVIDGDIIDCKKTAKRCP